MTDEISKQDLEIFFTIRSSTVSLKEVDNILGILIQDVTNQLQVELVEKEVKILQTSGKKLTTVKVLLQKA